MTTLLFCLLAPSQPDNDQNVEVDKADRLERCISRFCKKWPAPAIYVAERGNQIEYFISNFSSLSNLYQPRCTARCAGFVRTQR